MQINRIPGLTAGTLYQKATTAPSQVDKLLLTGEAILCAFIEGALNPMRPTVPQLLAEVPELATAFLNGQREQKNEYGFVYLGRWIWHMQDEDADHTDLDHWLIAP